MTESYVSEDIDVPSTAASNEQPILNEVSNDEQILNKEQKQLFYHILHLIKTSHPLYCFQSGGAGVGKSHLTKALYQAALKYFNTSW